jgi:hypothetical protein
MSKSLTQIIELHPLAPLKPEYGARCNGCEVCCACEPCPVAYVFLFQFSGRCRALLWQNDTGRYVCGMVVSPDECVRLIPTRLHGFMGRFFAARIAAEYGCDFGAEVVDTKIE